MTPTAMVEPALLTAAALGGGVRPPTSKKKSVPNKPRICSRLLPKAAPNLGLGPSLKSLAVDASVCQNFEQNSARSQPNRPPAKPTLRPTPVPPQASPPTPPRPVRPPTPTGPRPDPTGPGPDPCWRAAGASHGSIKITPPGDRSAKRTKPTSQPRRPKKEPQREPQSMPNEASKASAREAPHEFGPMRASPRTKPCMALNLATVLRFRDTDQGGQNPGCRGPDSFAIFADAPRGACSPPPAAALLPCILGVKNCALHIPTD